MARNKSWWKFFPCMKTGNIGIENFPKF